jgi:hypothetical protein
VCKLNVCFFNILWCFIFLKYTQWQCILSYDNSTAMYKSLKTLHPGGIRTRDFLGLSTLQCCCPNFFNMHCHCVYLRKINVFNKKMILALAGYIWDKLQKGIRGTDKTYNLTPFLSFSKYIWCHTHEHGLHYSSMYTYVPTQNKLRYVHCWMVMSAEMLTLSTPWRGFEPGTFCYRGGCGDCNATSRNFRAFLSVKRIFRRISWDTFQVQKVTPRSNPTFLASVRSFFSRCWHSFRWLRISTTIDLTVERTLCLREKKLPQVCT